MKAIVKRVEKNSQKPAGSSIPKSGRNANLFIVDSMQQLRPPVYSSKIIPFPSGRSQIVLA